MCDYGNSGAKVSKMHTRVHQKKFFLIIELSLIPFCSNGQEMLSVKKEHFSINI